MRCALLRSAGHGHAVLCTLRGRPLTASRLHHLYPQAFGAVEAMSDRTCIASKGKVNVHLSAEDLVSCCHICGFGCNGGYPGMAWKYWVHWGIVTGGNYNTSQVR